MVRSVVAVVVDHLRRDRLNRGWAGSPPSYHLVRRQLGFFTFPYFFRRDSACDFSDLKLLRISAHSLYLFDVREISSRSAECDLKYFVGVYFGGGVFKVGL